VAEEKADLLRALPTGGLAILNADDRLVAKMAAEISCPCLLFVESGGDIRLRVVSLDAELRAHIRADTPWGTVETVLAARGRHQVTNAGAAIAVGGHLGVPVDAMASALAEARISGSRMALKVADSGFKLIDDSYNANPESMRAALEALAALPALRRVAVVGEMTELGPISAQQHEYVAAEAKRLGIELIAVRAPEYGVHNVDDVGAAAEWLADLGEDDAVLVKASHVSGLGRLVALLCDPSTS
jgi:UDP-N-acetylmuramoyl-tripeptide--D-alanyl-D-alanine ligase